MATTITPVHPSEPGALAGFEVLCSRCGLRWRTSLRGIAGSEAVDHDRWHVKTDIADGLAAADAAMRKAVGDEAWDNATRCTTGPDAVTGRRCGKPAVDKFVGRDDVTVYAECAEHYHGLPPTPEPLDAEEAFFADWAAALDEAEAIRSVGPTVHGVECYEAWRELRDCPHELAEAGR